MKALIGSITRLARRSLLLTGIIALVVVVVIAGTVVVLGRGDGQSFPGTTAPGAHSWWDKGNQEAEFCNQCHAAIATELTAETNHNITACLTCHARDNNANHTAQPALCVDCHSQQAGKLADTSDAHVGLLADLGETETTASWTCKACHTKVSVDIDTTLMGPLQLTQD